MKSRDSAAFSIASLRVAGRSMELNRTDFPVSNSSLVSEHLKLRITGVPYNA